MGEAAEPRDDVSVVAREIHRRCIPGQPIPAKAYAGVLRGQVFGVHQRHVEELPPSIGAFEILAVGDGLFGNSLCRRIVVIGRGFAPPQIAGNLIQKQDEGERPDRGIGPMADPTCNRLAMVGSKALRNFAVHIRIRVPPRAGAQFLEPESADFFARPVRQSTRPPVRTAMAMRTALDMSSETRATLHQKSAIRSPMGRRWPSGAHSPV